MKKISRLILALALLLSSAQVSADIQVFGKDSLAEIQARYTRQPFLLVMWSIDCAPCRDEMLTIAKAQRQYGDLPIVLVSTDDSNYRDEVSTVLEDNQLNGLESWIFADSSHMALRYAIDPGWYGELPRTYLYNKAHERTGKSGALDHEDIEILVKMMGQ